MCQQLKSDVESLSKKSVAAEKPDDAMKFAQAALNVAHAFATLKGAEQLGK